MKNVILLFAILLVISCKNKQEEQPATPNDEATDLLEQTSGDPILAELFELMQGSFNSEKQSLADSSYYNISLHMYPIWKDKGNFLYVEQALNSRQNNPYRQRVYEVARWDDTHLSSAVYTLPNDSLWIGKWRTPEAFDSITPNDLELREGCAVILQ
ncbi:MAG: chromophore lyase CpcT/CpeT, partial [Bacteroidota bacterium]